MTAGGTRTDFRPGTITNTGRDLDVGDRRRRVLRDRDAVRRPLHAQRQLHAARRRRADHGGRRAGARRAEPADQARHRARSRSSRDGTIRVGDAPAGKIQLWQFEREGSRFASRARGSALVAGRQADARRPPCSSPGSLEQSNVSLVDRMAMLTEVTRSFEALQKGVSVLMNDIDGRAITELGSGNDGAGSDGPGRSERGRQDRRGGNDYVNRSTTGVQRFRRHPVIRALYTAASGMNAQQANIDNVAHNLANVNTTGFKKSRVEFEDLVYQQIKAPGIADVARRAKRRSASRPASARARWRPRATSAAATCAATELAARPRDRRRRASSRSRCPAARPATRAPARCI